MHNPVDSSPLVRVFGLPSDDAEALENIDNVIDAPPLDPKLLSALIEQKNVLFLLAIDAEELAAKLP